MYRPVAVPSVFSAMVLLLIGDQGVGIGSGHPPCFRRTWRGCGVRWPFWGRLQSQSVGAHILREVHLPFVTIVSFLLIAASKSCGSSFLCRPFRIPRRLCLPFRLPRQDGTRTGGTASAEDTSS